jgi:hypothetical protein
MVDNKGNFTTVSDDIRNQSNKFTLSKLEDELFKDDANVVMPIIRVKHITLPNKNDRWRIFADNDQIVIVEGAKLTKTERTFLRGLEGVNFLIAEVKSGVKSFNGIKLALKNRLKKKRT